MNLSQLANELQALVVLSLTAIVWLKLLPMQRLDELRQRLFVLRDEMFDYAAEGNISFDDPAYMLLRNQMNGFIRFGHQVTLFRLLMSACGRSVNGNLSHSTWIKSWDMSIKKVSDQKVRRDMIEFHERASAIVAKHLVRGSVVLSILVMLGVVVGAATEGFVSLKHAWNKASKRVLSGPIDPRVIEEQAFCTI